jgi:predicted MPP superfamily phosphohydrolase
MIRERPLSFGARAHLVEHHVAEPRWDQPDLRIAVISDLHVCQPWTNLSALGRLVGKVNALKPDLTLIAGDFLASRKLPARRVPARRIVKALEPLRAPLGVHAVLGNHDWWDCDIALATKLERNSVREAIEESHIELLENRSVRLDHGSGIWLAGIDTIEPRRGKGHPGRHDPAAAFAEVPEGAPAILLAHEPDYFAEGDVRAVLQISGHTHGGQAVMGRWRPFTPSAHGARFAWGHVRDEGRHLVVSGGVGYSGIPVRLFQPPEITLVTLTRG